MAFEIKRRPSLRICKEPWKSVFSPNVVWEFILKGLKRFEHLCGAPEHVADRLWCGHTLSSVTKHHETSIVTISGSTDILNTHSRPPAPSVFSRVSENTFILIFLLYLMTTCFRQIWLNLKCQKQFTLFRNTIGKWDCQVTDTRP